MSAEEALPVLRTVLARRDPCSVPLRLQALALAGRSRSSASVDLLSAVAKDDADDGVRDQAVFWLSRSHDERTVPLLDSVLTHSADASLRSQALIGLAQNNGVAAQAALRRFASHAGVPEEALRETAIYWVGRGAQSGDSASVDLLMAVARNQREDSHLRQFAINLLGQTDDPRVAPFLQQLIKSR